MHDGKDTLNECILFCLGIVGVLGVIPVDHREATQEKRPVVQRVEASQSLSHTPQPSARLHCTGARFLFQLPSFYILDPRLRGDDSISKFTKY
jgi:hypothetical protein